MSMFGSEKYRDLLRQGTKTQRAQYAVGEGYTLIQRENDPLSGDSCPLLMTQKHVQQYRERYGLPVPLGCGVPMMSELCPMGFFDAERNLRAVSVCVAWSYLLPSDGTPMDRYRKLEEQLVEIRARYDGKESDEEDALLEVIDDVYWELDDEDRRVIENEPPVSQIDTGKELG